MLFHERVPLRQGQCELRNRKRRPKKSLEYKVCPIFLQRLRKKEFKSVDKKASIKLNCISALPDCDMKTGLFMKQLTPEELKDDYLAASSAV